MKQTLIKIFWPILKFFEGGEQPANYKPSHRIALNVLASVFIVLSLGSAWAASESGGPGAFIPIIVFFCLGSVGVIVGTLGSNGAVSKIWGTK